MKIQIISDLHQEFGITELSFDNADVVVIPGDVNLGIKGFHWIQSRIKDKPVIYVLGNHEYYKSSYPKVLNKLKILAKNTNIHVLEDSFIDIDDIRFHGCTLWTDFSIFGDPMEYGIICQSVMNDYKMIKRDPSYSKFIKYPANGWMKVCEIPRNRKILSLRIMRQVCNLFRNNIKTTR